MFLVKVRGGNSWLEGNYQFPSWKLFIIGDEADKGDCFRASAVQASFCMKQICVLAGERIPSIFLEVFL